MSERRPISAIERRLLRSVGRAIEDFDLIQAGDRILVALSGGKDSYGLLALLDRLQSRAPIPFELIPWHLDQVQPGYDGSSLRGWLEARGGDFVIAQEDTYSVVVDRVPEGKTYCSLCSRLRRGILYNAAVELGCNKIALGHHGDDAIETVLLNLFFSGQLKAMPPWLRSDDGRNQVIRPLIYCFESELEGFAAERDFPILPCNLCSSQEGQQRQAIKALINSLEESNPEIRQSMLAAISNVRPTHLPDGGLWEALGLGPQLPDLLRSGLMEQPALPR